MDKEKTDKKENNMRTIFVLGIGMMIGYAYGFKHGLDELNNRR